MLQKPPKLAQASVNQWVRSSLHIHANYSPLTGFRGQRKTLITGWLFSPLTNSPFWVLWLHLLPRRIRKVCATSFSTKYDDTWCIFLDRQKERHKKKDHLIGKDLSEQNHSTWSFFQYPLLKQFSENIFCVKMLRDSIEGTVSEFKSRMLFNQ